MYNVPKLTDYSQPALEKAAHELLRALQDEADAVASEAEWKIFRDRWMARKNGVLTLVNDEWLKTAPQTEKRQVGRLVNELKTRVEQSVDGALERARARASADKGAERLDITLPGIRRRLGSEHPVIKTNNEMVEIFRNLGYSVEEGPEIETDYYNFEALNFPANHPARDMQDTLFVAGQ